VVSRFPLVALAASAILIISACNTAEPVPVRSGIGTGRLRTDRR